ncbi:unnamed protein product, partial [Polarella glacialis]
AASDCPVCFDSDCLQVRFPCGHSLCTECFSKPLRSVQEQPPTEQEFGCPASDDLDVQDTFIEAWRAAQPSRAATFDAALDRWDALDSERRCEFLEVLRRCPLCRRLNPLSGDFVTWRPAQAVPMEWHC